MIGHRLDFKLALPKTLSCGIDEWTYKQMGKWKFATPITHKFLNNSMSMILCGKLHYYLTSTSQKTILTKNLSLSGTAELQISNVFAYLRNAKPQIPN